MSDSSKDNVPEVNAGFSGPIEIPKKETTWTPLKVEKKTDVVTSWIPLQQPSKDKTNVEWKPLETKNNPATSVVESWTPLQSPHPVESQESKNSIITKSPNNYISFVSDTPEVKGEAGIIGKVDIVHLGNVTAYCASSEEGVTGHSGELEFGQDAAAVVKKGAHYILVEADGVGQAYLSEIAARESTIAVAKNPSLDLTDNLKTASDHLMHLQLPDPNTGIKMLDEGLLTTREIAGSQTMFNQMSVDSTTGKVDGLFLGDGGFTILRTNGDRSHFPPKDKLVEQGNLNLKSRLSTKEGIIGNPRTLQEVVGQEVILNPGDSILVYSDALQHSVDKSMLIDQVCDIVSSGNEIDKSIATLFEKAGKLDPSDDDKSLLRYSHSA